MWCWLSVQLQLLWLDVCISASCSEAGLSVGRTTGLGGHPRMCRLVLLPSHQSVTQESLPGDDMLKLHFIRTRLNLSYSFQNMNSLLSKSIILCISCCYLKYIDQYLISVVHLSIIYAIYNFLGPLATFCIITTWLDTGCLI